MKTFIQKEKHSFKVAFNGLRLLLNEKHFIVHLCIAAITIFFGFVTNINKTEWIMITFCIAMVLAAEATNTAIEKTVDYISTDISPEAKAIKDISAAMVLITAIASVIIGICIFFF